MARWKRVRSYSYSEAQKAKRSSLYGPLRVARLCVLSIIVPGLLLSIPLYMRYNVYIQQAYPVGMSDIRLLDNRISTTWCQRQVVWSNATYNAFLMQEQPEIRPDTVKVSMTRQLVLEDDSKEYWGFYLLQGSTVTVSTCVRWPGASLIMIRGHKHLKQCAYIGDDSSEELDELFEGDGVNNTSIDYDISNKPTSMKKVRDGVLVEGRHVDISSVHHHRKPFHASAVEDALRDNWKMDNKKGPNVHLRYAEYMMNPKKTKDNEEFKMNPNVVNVPMEAEMAKTSREVYNEMLDRLRKMGPKGRVLLDQLNKNLAEEGKSTMNVNVVEQSTEPANGQDSTKSQKIPESSTKTDSTTTKRDLQNRKRRRRNIPTIGKTAAQLTLHDEAADNAAEEMDMKPDGEADFRGRINETTDNDQSNSEFWSSFSSSEERLLECEGLLLNLPLTPHHACEAHRPETVLTRASGANTVTYKVPSNGYYFFIFNSENEVQPNFLHIHFRLEKTTYNVTNAVAACHNQTGSCSLPLRFWSRDKVILELPVRPNDTLWNEEFLAVSTCEPRTALYIACVIAVPLLIILFAFQ
uniref:E3 ubiquitin-protein ligase APD1-4 middle domain-containing protein n=1 Tax=Graphocephala atropunctata TaxID=36148 RepID=A0A1B6LJN2_9HEMI